MSTDAAHILFPNDAPTSSQPPEWFKAQHAAAEQRLMGQHRQDDGARAAATMFPSEAKGAVSGEARPPAGHDPDADAAEKLFKEDATQFDAKPVSDFMSGFAQSAIADGDIDRAHELESASEALAADFRAAGASSDDVREALDIMREHQGNTVAGPVSAEALEAGYASGMAALADEGVTSADLNAARAFISDLEKIAPGTIRSLEATGAGNDPRLIRKAVAEAKRRGYR